MRLTICGDICPSRINDLWVKGDVNTLFHDVPQSFKASDRVLVNLETALTTQNTPIQKIGPNLKADPGCAGLLRSIGVTDCSLSNNHVFDFGTPGARDTIRAVTEAGLNYTGFGENAQDARRDLVIQQDGLSVAVIAVCEHEYCYALPDRMGARAFDVLNTMEDIRKAKAQHDYVVVLYHGGKEQSIYPSPRLRKVCRHMVRQGADVVLCQHSHCVGCYEQYESGHILYGQGNFHFVEPGNTHPHWQWGLMVHLDIGETLKPTFVPVQVVDDSGICLAKGPEAEELMAAFAKQCADLQNDNWLSGWEQFCEENREKYRNVIANAAEDPERFGHYLYCEAHRDVWEQLYQLSWETRKEP